MKCLLTILIVIFVGLQYRLWVGDGSFADRARLEREISQQSAENLRMTERNRVLAVEVADLKNGDEMIEARARSDIGMIKNGETFFMTHTPDD
ncbi:FtsB family cell division protein [Gilvimarinus polysaccharolyticus]|uniref:FtsB family cell division protein n=1 Tax=Gilvimarinus polysaccharolyticus TaxID=863921 RepID=UPI000673A793|nr:septum formation initiator family protein [Gilvimarinus polysaccharolyticus]